MQVGELSEPVPMKTDDNKDAYRLLYLKRKTAPHKANLKDDYTLISTITSSTITLSFYSESTVAAGFYTVVLIG